MMFSVYTDNLFKELMRNKKTSEGFQNFSKDNVNNIYKTALFLQDNGFFAKDKLYNILEAMCKDQDIKKKFDHQFLLWIFCMDPNLELIKLVYGNKMANIDIEKKALEEFKIGPKYLKEFVKLELEFWRNFDFKLLEDIELIQKENYTPHKK